MYAISLAKHSNANTSVRVTSDTVDQSFFSFLHYVLSFSLMIYYQYMSKHISIQLLIINIYDKNCLSLE